MGIFEAKVNTPDKTEVTQGNKQNEQHEQITGNNPNNMHQKHLRYYECEVDPLNHYKYFDPDISKELSKKICKIVIEEESVRKTGTGFILAFLIDLKWFVCLMTNDHIISNESINNKKIIYLSYEEYKTASIKLDKNKRYIKSFKDKNLDITVVQLLDEDNISKYYFLEPELDIPLNNNLINKEIYIPLYIEGLKLKKSEGIIKDIIKYELSHSANTKKGSSGSPIFLKNSDRVIGIHKESAPIIKENYGDFIYPVINMINKDIIKRSNNGKYIYDDGNYYIGEFKNNIPNGKGVKYYKNGNILYDGYFINGIFEGNGKYILENGLYYIGQFKNGLRKGKGILY